ncbi:MAG: hypothetical protein WCI71_00785 [Bacteroidota bacterium]
MTKEEATAKITELQAKLDISKTQWYDIYAKGVLLKAPEASRRNVDPGRHPAQTVQSGGCSRLSGIHSLGIGEQENLFCGGQKEPITGPLS